MSLNFCDLLVLGSDLSGVMAATLLAKRGLNVLILDDDPDNDLQPNLITGLGAKGFKSFLGKLMIPDSKLQVLHENKVGCQVIFPRHRLDLYSSRPALLKEIEREFPGERALFEELIGEADHLREAYLEEAFSYLPLVSEKEKKKFIKWFQSFPEQKLLSLWNQLSPAFQCLIKVQLRFFSRNLIMDPPILQLLLFLTPEGLTSYSIRGGARELKKIFFDKLDYFGGMVHPLREDTFQILSKGQEIRGAQLTRYNFPTRCRYLLGNMDIKSLYRELPTPLLSFFSQRKKKVFSLNSAEERRVVQYQLAKKILPEPMKENVIIVSDPLAPLVGSNYLEVNLYPLYKGASEDFDTLMTVTYSIPASKPETEEAQHQDLLEKTHQEIDRHLRKLLPFSGTHLKRIFPKTSEPVAEPTLFPEETEEANPLDKIKRGQVAYSPSLVFPTLESNFKNLTVVGPNILDWLGMEGKMLTALKAVEAIWTQELKTKN